MVVLHGRGNGVEQHLVWYPHGTDPGQDYMGGICGSVEVAQA